ncbi:hypothetical protein AC579_7062 [Pseudocercospora musae]|uniref:Nucleoporin Nup159/Nup146 N-terminal domain-containing protein n=1 Tax=Pseudocercospora musae TaxID=113226 RepID=A0A139I1L3_9PEZI|nr:hypothetical protein AC579_7062 [Pseudocercospora musae]
MNFGDGGSNARAGHVLPHIETDDIALADISLQKGGNPVKLTRPWETQPPVHASLLTIASAKGILAVAGPSSLVIANTESLRRQAIPKRLEKGEERLIRENGVPVEGKAYAVREDEPSPIPAKAHLIIDTPRLSHVAFSADESCLVIVSEQGGGLAVYDTNALVNGNKESAFSIGTNGVSVRHLLPNPNPDEATAHLFAIVLTNGQLLLADLKARNLRKGQSSEAFHDNVFSACWSKMGKQIIAGKGDGSCAQIDPQGVLKDSIPVAPQLKEMKQADYQEALNMPVSTIHWLETHKFLIIYSPVYGQQDPDAIPPMNDSVYFIAERQKGQPFNFHKFAEDPCPPFGLERLPANHFLSRLTEWEPNVADMIIASSTASLEVGILGQGQFVDASDEATGGKNWKKAEPYAGIMIKDDVRRAALPTSYIADGADTSSIGTAIDYGTKILASRPIPTESDTIEDSPHPVPCFCLMNTDGLLYMWWIIYPDSIRENKAHPRIVHKSGPFITYNDLATKYNRPLDDNAQEIAPEIIEPSPGELGSQKPAAATQTPQPTTMGQGLSGPRPATPTTSASLSSTGTSQTPRPLFGGASALGGNQSSAWGAQSATLGASTFGKPAFGQTSAVRGSAFAQAAQKGGTGFGQVGGLGQNNESPWAADGQSSAASPFGAAAKPNPFANAGQASASPFAGAGQNKASPFAAAGQTSTSPFASAGKTAPSPFGGAGQNTSSPFGSAGQSSQSPFASAGQTLGGNSAFGGSSFGNPSLPNETSTGSTATLGSTGTFGAPSTPGASSFNSKPALSKESTMGDANESQSSEGLPSLSQGFKLGSTFRGDGTAHDDLPRPKNPGSDWFGSLGNTLSNDENTKPEIKQEPGTEKQPTLKDFPSAFPEQKSSGILGQSNRLASMPLPSGLFDKKGESKAPTDAPLPPDPKTFDYKKKQAEMGSIFDQPKIEAPAASTDAPLPPDPSNFNYKKKLAEMEAPPTAAKPNPFAQQKDVPIAGSPPQDITHSQTFSPAASEAGPPEESGSEDWDDEDEGEDAEGEEDDEDEDEEDEENDEDEDEEDEEDEDEEGDEEDDESVDESDEEEVRYEPQNAAALEAFLKRTSPADPKSPEARKPNTKSTTPKAQSYTPAGFPKGPILAPSGQRKTEQSPRSPSPQRQPAQQRTVTSPFPKAAPKGDMTFPPQIKTTSVPPAKPVEREKTPAAHPKPKAPTAGELADEQDARVKALLAQPIEPNKALPPFHAHQDYTGAVETQGIGGQIEKVFRDVNSMIDVVGLNARSLHTFIAGHERLRIPGPRSREDLEDPDAWTLAEIAELARVIDEIGKQLEAGKLDNVRDTLELLIKEQSEVIKLKARTTEMRKQILCLSDPARRAEHDAAPLDAETAVQQSELRRKLRDVYQLLSDVEQKMSLLRADLASASTKAAVNGKPVPTMESVERTILKMTAMVEKTSGDVDLLESQIRRLPNGPASLRNGGLGDDYEDALVGSLVSSKLLNDSPSRKRTPQKYPRMAADGSALGMSGMFGSRFQTPPSASVRASPGMKNSMLALRQSTGSLNGSVRKKTMADVTDDEVEAYYARIARRRDVLGALRRGVERSGPREVRVE